MAGGVASGAALPMKKTAKTSQTRIEHPHKVNISYSMLPVKKPGMLKAAIEETIKAEGLIGRVFNSFSGGKRLSEDDAARYANIFAFQDTGDFAKADVEIAKLADQRLMGHVLYARYLHPEYKSTYDELSAWVRIYQDHPGVQKIAELARRKKPAATADTLPAIKPVRGLIAQHDFDVGQLAQPYLKTTRMSQREKEMAQGIERIVAKSPTAALKKLETEEAKKVLSHTQYDALRALVAESYFYNGKNDKALELAMKSADRSGKEVPKAGWIAGLASWKNKDYATAAKYFENAARSKRSSAWMSAATSYWTARAYLRAERPEKVNYWLARATQHPRTFYGIIALKALGLSEGSFNWDVPELKDRHVRALASNAAGRRALALVDAERPDLAAEELAQMNPGNNAALKEAMIALATKTASMPSVSLRLGSAIRDSEGGLYDAALYPDAPWAPQGGFDVDRALVYAFIRQESRFRTDAQNGSSGAVGLMQLMPATAQHVAKQTGDKVEKADLKDPVVNITLGQKYLAELLKNENIGGNLFKLAVAYNAGPGKLARWQKAADSEEDPLFFIETIPAAETRIFVERVLTNYWIYRIKYDQDTESLDKVAEGEWPVYVAHDITRGSRFADAATFFSR